MATIGHKKIRERLTQHGEYLRRWGQETLTLALEFRGGRCHADALRLAGGMVVGIGMKIDVKAQQVCEQPEMDRDAFARFVEALTGEFVDEVIFRANEISMEGKPAAAKVGAGGGGGRRVNDELRPGTDTRDPRGADDAGPAGGAAAGSPGPGWSAGRAGGGGHG
ncbi:MAG TPA: hypothetical protein VHM90_07100 [Phycisphaerae bacterium]|nr:hypothetical protein [Phycisphaerae bacterium]